MSHTPELPARHPVSALLTAAEYSRLATIAIRRKQKPSQYVTELVRKDLLKRLVIERLEAGQ